MTSNNVTNGMHATNRVAAYFCFLFLKLLLKGKAMSKSMFSFYGCFVDWLVRVKFFSKTPGHYEPNGEWVTIPDFQRYRIVDPDRPAKGPVIAPLKGAATRAVLVEIDDAAIPILDRYELASGNSLGGGYRRITANVQRDSGELVESQIYCADEKMHEYVLANPGSPWCPAEFLHQFRNFYYQRLEEFLSSVESLNPQPVRSNGGRRKVSSASLRQ